MWPERKQGFRRVTAKPLLAPVIRIVLDMLGLLEGSFDTAFRNAQLGKFWARALWSSLDLFRATEVGMRRFAGVPALHRPAGWS